MTHKSMNQGKINANGRIILVFMYVKWQFDIRGEFNSHLFCTKLKEYFWLNFYFRKRDLQPDNIFWIIDMIFEIDILDTYAQIKETQIIFLLKF